MSKWIAIAAVAVVAIGGGAIWLREQSALHAAAGQAEQAMKPELEACKERLAGLHSAWAKYRKDHGGAEPRPVDVLLPRYVKDPELLVCPAVTRWKAAGYTVEQGTLKFKGRDIPVTYRCEWLTASHPVQRKSLGEQAPLITCDTHREILYHAVYHKRPPLGAFDEPNRGRLIGEVANAPVLAVLRNGQVEVRGGPEAG
jgi:hypothetical protein